MMAAVWHLRSELLLLAFEAMAVVQVLSLIPFVVYTEPFFVNFCLEALATLVQDLAPLS